MESYAKIPNDDHATEAELRIPRIKNANDPTTVSRRMKFGGWYSPPKQRFQACFRAVLAFTIQKPRLYGRF